MIPKIKKILYATDLSKNSAYAFRYAINTAEKHDAKITIISVFTEPIVDEFPVELIKVFDEAKAGLKDKMKARVEAIIARELKDKPEARERIEAMEVLDGDPAGLILQKAEEINADVLIMGTHGKGIIAHTFLGSVAEKVLQRIRIPVFIIPIPKTTDIAFND